MLYNIDGINFRNLLDYGIRSLAVYKDKVNALNVFPVPDGDTGTNMLLTLQNGYEAISETEASLGETARSFSRAIVFGARGNSGVIVSQFFRGLCESLYDKETADFCELVSAFENGVVSAYKSVSKPVEGTILTVIREAIEHVRKELDDYRLDSVNEVISAFIDKAKSTLNNTPNMLAVLKSANVVDSGGAGIIYVFEGMRCYLDGKPLPVYEHNQPSAAKKANDFSKFNKNSLFEYGYCTELLIQLTFRADSFSVSAFKDELSELGDSIVVSYEDDKVKLHIHTFAPEKVLTHCHTYGEFLSLKIENMSVQHRETMSPNIVVSDNEPKEFSLLAVAHNSDMEKAFIEMGADVIVNVTQGGQPTAQELVDAFEAAPSESIIIFPNNKNTLLTVRQAASLCRDINILTVETKNDSECYALLPLVDFDCDDAGSVFASLAEALENIDTVCITRAVKNADFDNVNVKIGDYVAIADTKKILSSGNSLAYVVGSALKQSFSECGRDIVTVFASPSVPDNIKEAIVAYVENHNPLAEVTVIDVSDDYYTLVITLE